MGHFSRSYPAATQSQRHPKGETGRPDPLTLGPSADKLWLMTAESVCILTPSYIFSIEADLSLSWCFIPPMADESQRQAKVHE